MRILLSVLVLVSFFSATAQPSETKGSPELVVHLLDYLAKDYGGAVANGKVVSDSEYAEQIEFAAIVLKNAQGVESLKANTQFSAEVTRLQKLIADKGSAEEVSKLARTLQQEAIRLANIDVSPRSNPDLKLGEKLYQTNCALCHGPTGHGDGAAGAGLDPKPANFHDEELTLNSAPYKFYNTIRLGVPGTGMASFSQLSDEEVWALAFYLKSLPFKGIESSTLPAQLSLKDTATLTDKEILGKLGPESSLNSVKALRAAGTTSIPNDPFKIAQSLLNESINAAKENRHHDAATLSIRAYLEGIEPMEPKLQANMSGFVVEVEELMASFRSAVESKEPVPKLEAINGEISKKLSEARETLSRSKMSPAVAFGAAFSIFLREGFEAVLIIVVLLSILRAMNEPHAIKWVHAGWASAIVVGIAAWFASGAILSMSGMGRELMEGLISLFAVCVLVYVGFWLHKYSNMKKWREFLEARLQAGLKTGSYFALAVVAFMAVFREAFEVVLFLRAIFLDLDPSGQNIAGLGVLSSLLVLAILSYIAIKQSKKLPLDALFKVCSWTMMALAVVLIGKGMHSLQEAGILSVTAAITPVRIDLLGIYPSYQTLCAQALLITVFAILLVQDLGKKGRA